ncbi:MAG: O-antigen ligase family protein [Candidatus Thiodiazotropha sp. (ex Dulcina madagascariensis)]|nr:O-antigen ligase family protein [Candidatus Thiodiazotropha sp. (ex Dulcina madagascariensis)]
MLVMLSYIITFVGSLLIFSGIAFPILAVESYIIIRPLIQPFAWLQYKLFSLPIAFPFSITLIVIGLILPVINRRWNLFVRKSGLFVIYLSIAILSTALSDDIILSVATIAKLITVWFLFNISYNSVATESDALRIIDALIVSSLIPLLIGFYQAFTGQYNMIHDAEVDRVSSVFGTGNDYGIFLTFITAALIIRLYLTNVKWMKLVVIIVMLMVLVSQVLSLNRGTWIALLLGFFVSAVKYRRYLNFKWLVVGGTVFMLMFSGRIIERFNELEDPAGVHYSGVNTLEGRLNHWTALMPVVMERPLLGYGAGMTSIVSQKTIGNQHKPHNDYLLVCLETGILGLFAYVAFLIRIFIHFILRHVSNDLWMWNFSMLMLIVYFIIISGVQNIVQSIMNFAIFMIFVAVVLKINYLARTNKRTLNRNDMQSVFLGNNVKRQAISVCSET